MVDISKKIFEHNDIEVVVDDIGMLCLNGKHVEEKLGHKNLAVITNMTQYTKSTAMNL